MDVQLRNLANAAQAWAAGLSKTVQPVVAGVVKKAQPWIAAAKEAAAASIERAKPAALQYHARAVDALAPTVAAIQRELQQRMHVNVDAALLSNVILGVCTLIALLLLWGMLSVVCCPARPKARKAKAAEAAESTAGVKPDGRMYCCVPCAVDLPDTTKEVVNRHMEGKKHKKAVEGLLAAGKPVDKGSVLAWLPPAEFAALWQRVHGSRLAEERERAADLSDEEPIVAQVSAKDKIRATGKAGESIGLLGKGVAVVFEQKGIVHGGGGGGGGGWSKVNEGGRGVTVAKALAGPTATANLMSSFMHVEGGRNVLAGLAIWSKFLTPAQESNIIKLTRDALGAAHSGSMRPGSFTPSRGKAAAQLHYGIRYDLLSGGAQLEKPVDPMPHALADIGRGIVACGETLKLPPRCILDCATVMVLEKGMYLPPHAFDMATFEAPVLLLVCGSDVEVRFGGDIEPGAREGDFQGGYMQLVHHKSLLVLAEPVCSATKHCIPAVNQNCVVVAFYATQAGARRELEAKGSIRP